MTQIEWPEPRAEKIALLSGLIHQHLTVREMELAISGASEWKIRQIINTSRLRRNPDYQVCLNRAQDYRNRASSKPETGRPRTNQIAKAASIDIRLFEITDAPDQSALVKEVDTSKCRWPYDVTPPVYCGCAKAKPSASYCDYHQRVAYWQPDHKERAGSSPKLNPPMSPAQGKVRQ